MAATAPTAPAAIRTRLRETIGNGAFIMIDLPSSALLAMFAAVQRRAIGADSIPSLGSSDLVSWNSRGTRRPRLAPHAVRRANGANELSGDSACCPLTSCLGRPLFL